MNLREKGMWDGTVPTAEDSTEEETRCQEKNGKICQKSVKHVNGLPKKVL